MGLGWKSALFCVSEEGFPFTFLESAFGSPVVFCLFSGLSGTVPLST